MTDQLAKAFAEAKQIATTAHPIYELHEHRWLFAFSVQDLYVVAPINSTNSALALLIIEQCAILQAQKSSVLASAVIDSVKELPDGGFLQ